MHFNKLWVSALLVMGAWNPAIGEDIPQEGTVVTPLRLPEPGRISHPAPPAPKANSTGNVTTIARSVPVDEATTYQVLTEQIKCQDGELQRSVPLYFVDLLSKWQGGADLRINQIKSGDPALPTGVVEFSFGPIHKCLADEIGAAPLTLGKEDGLKKIGFEPMFLNPQTSMDVIIDKCVSAGALKRSEDGQISINSDASAEDYREVKFTANIPTDGDYQVLWKSFGPFGVRGLFPHGAYAESISGELPCAQYEYPRADAQQNSFASIKLESKKTILESQIYEMCCKEAGLENYEDAIELAKTHKLSDLQKSLEKEYSKAVAKEFEDTFKKFKENPETLQTYIDKNSIYPLYDLIDKYEKHVVSPIVQQMEALFVKWETAKKNNSRDLTKIQAEIEALQTDLRRIITDVASDDLVKFLETQGEFALSKGVHNITSYKPYLKLARIGSESRKLYTSKVVKSEMEDLRQDYDNQMDEKQVEYRVAHGLEAAPSVSAVKKKYEKMLEREYKRFKAAHCAATEKAQSACAMTCPMCNLGWSAEQCQESSRSLAQFPQECSQCAESTFASSSCKGYMSDYKGFPQAYDETKRKIIAKYEEELARAEKLAALEDKYMEDNESKLVTVEEGDSSDDDIESGDYSSSVSKSSSSSSSSSRSSSYNYSSSAGMPGYNPMGYMPGSTSSMWGMGAPSMGYGMGGGFSGSMGMGMGMGMGMPSYGYGSMGMPGYGYGGMSGGMSGSMGMGMGMPSYGYGGMGMGSPMGYGMSGYSSGYGSNPFGFANGSGMSTSGYGTSTGSMMMSPYSTTGQSTGNPFGW